MQKRLLGLAAVPALVLGLSSCGSDDSSASDTNTTPPATTPAATPASTPASTAPSTPSGGSSTTLDSGTGGVSCTYVASGTPARPVDLPPSTPTYTSKTPATITTTAGVLHVTLNGDTTPCTVNSFASLASQGFYDKTPCPRITTDPGFQVLQCGDPTGTTGGGPGYTFADELTGTETYPAGTLAMANTGQPASNGSQFFVVYGDTQLQPAYTVFGTVDTKDLAGITQIAAKGSDNSNPNGGGKPATPIDITSVTVGQ